MKLVVWGGLAIAVSVRVILLCFGAPKLLGRSIEVATPVTSLFRLAEGMWLQQLGSSPYAGHAYHGSPLLLASLGPIGSESTLIFLLADLLSALLLFLLGKILFSDHKHQHSEGINVNGEIVALLYLLNPFTIMACVGGSTSPIENLIVILALYAAVAGNTPLAAFGWVAATHLSLYPLILFIPIFLLLCFGPDKPPKESSQRLRYARCFDFLFWSTIWWLSILGLCSLMLKKHGGIHEMISKTYGFILKVEDLTPNSGLYWYFFTEVFEFFRPFFLMVFHGNILCMIIPLTIRFHHRPLFLSFLFIAISSMLKSYPSVADAALYLGIVPLFLPELSDFRYSFPLLNGYIVVALLGPVMYNLWIWRGTGNANFYFAITLVYALIQVRNTGTDWLFTVMTYGVLLLQMIFVVESSSTMLRYDRSLKMKKKKEKKEKSC